ncbi:MAG: RNA methyltransferase [Chitinophagaceae bacterium]|nr:RNA methyltransferase [Chitinophagaceae bacterium]
MITKSEVKYIQSLGHKKFRDELNQFVAEGPKIVIELLNSPAILPKALYATSEWWRNNSTLRQSLSPEMAVEVKEQELERISSLTTPNQVLGVFHKMKQPPNPSLQSRVSLMLDGIQDPGNMGTLVRLADWFGIGYIIAGIESADVYNPKVVQATMGSIARVQVLYRELSPFIRDCGAVPVYATTLDGAPLASYPKIKEGIVLIGNESKGIHPDLIAVATHKITIPRFGGAESLNAGVAAGIVLSHLL